MDDFYQSICTDPLLSQVIASLNLDPEDVVLGQGTLRPDLIESASGLASNRADVIKTHHNDTELVRKLRANNQVVEPLTEFHKVGLLTERIFFVSPTYHGSCPCIAG